MNWLALYFVGMALTAGIVWLLPSPPPRAHEWAIALIAWPFTILVLMAIGVRR